MKIGFIGLGIMGRPMAKNLLKAGYDVTVDSHSPAAAAELEACGAKVADQPTIGSTCDLVLTMLPNAPQVKQVMLGANGVAAHMQPGSTFIDMTSLNPIASKEIAAEQRAASGRLVGAVGDLLYCIPIIKAWGSERFEAAGFHAFSHQMYTLNRKSQRIFNVYWGITYTLMTIGYLSAVIFSARSALAGAATAGSIAVAYSYMSNILTPAASISRYGNDIFQADAALARVFELKPAAASPAAPYAVSYTHLTLPTT